MRRRMPKPAWPGLVAGTLVLLLLTQGCDGTRTVSLVAEDFRFVPDYVHVESAPLVLSVYNAGRETHEFDSPILVYAAKTAPTPLMTGSPGSPGIPIQPGQSLHIAVAPPPGTYLYICRRKGHANMTGTFVVE